MNKDDDINPIFHDMRARLQAALIDTPISRDFLNTPSTWDKIEQITGWRPER